MKMAAQESSQATKTEPIGLQSPASTEKPQNSSVNTMPLE
ncbi:hypothetical protein Ahy_A03g013576 isoform B [Arachis hypogaea]|uniref:Uncharacterized protein n=1 Tax=Arachis hypogaea TaxID=3818 RepID=A0A445DVR2_ARAHY|nr:hypothetical protein Ahy_A03g013576 isoform B [Arachis hypogaea]